MTVKSFPSASKRPSAPLFLALAAIVALAAFWLEFMSPRAIAPTTTTEPAGRPVVRTESRPVTAAGNTLTRQEAFSLQLTEGVTTATDEAQLAATLQGVMTADFALGYYRSEWQSLAPEKALAELAPYFVGQSDVKTRLLEKAPSRLLGGINPYRMMGPGVEVTAVHLAQGLGASGTDEALLFVAKIADRSAPAGFRYAWTGILVAPNGFVPVIPAAPASTDNLLLAYHGGGLFKQAADGTLTPFTDTPAVLSPRGTYAVYPDFASDPNTLVVISTENGQSQVVDVFARLVGCYSWVDEAHVLCGIRLPNEEDGPNLGHLSRINITTGDMLSFNDSYLFSLPAVSNDGELVAFDAGDGRAMLWRGENVTEFDFTHFTGAPQAANSIGSPSIATDGRLAWLVGNGATTEVVVFDLEKQTAASVFNFEPLGFGGYFPAAVWSPDNQWLAIHALASSDEAAGLYVVATDGSITHRIGGRDLSNPVWLNGDQLIITRGDLSGMQPSRIELYNMATGEFTVLDLPAGTYSVGLLR